MRVIHVRLHPQGGDLQGIVPSVMLHGKGRSKLVDYKVVVDRDLSQDHGVPRM